jgi:potassium efflux system protein
MRDQEHLSTDGFLNRPALLSLVLAAVFSSGAVALAQDAPKPDATPAPTATPEPTAITAAEIPERAAATGRLIREAVAATQVGEEIAPLEKLFAEEQKHIASLEEETMRRLEIDGPASVLEETEKAWQRVGTRLDGWLQELQNRGEAIGRMLARLETEQRIWELTSSSSPEIELPPEVYALVDQTLDAIQIAIRDVRSHRDAVLTLQSRITRMMGKVDEFLVVQQEEINRRRRNIIGIDSPPLWRAFTTPGVDGSPGEQFAAIWTRNFQSVRQYATDEQSSLLRHLLLLIGLTVMLVSLQGKARLWAQQDRSLQKTVRVLDRPFSAALVMSLLVRESLHPDAARAWINLLGLIFLLALLRVLPVMVTKALRPTAYILALLFFFLKAVEFAPDGNLPNRILLLLLATAAAGACLWLDRKMESEKPVASEGWRRAIVLGTRISFVAFAVGGVANIVGSVGFATLVIAGTLHAVFSAVIYWVAVVLVQAIVRVVLLTRFAKSFGIVRLHSDTVLDTSSRAAKFLAVLGWVATTLDGFKVLGVAGGALRRAAKETIAVGEFSIVPADILLFVVIVWLSFKLSQLFRFVLDTDVMPRVGLPRGVPGAITRLSHYAIVVVGVMIAASAAGLDFSKINLIVGALGVGIGFGLQNVVNNFVSGLILLFERPIRVDDKIQHGELFGVVEKIGMRASIVKTFQGAEVIVPNANLISAEVVNWTLSDERRRIEFSVGVAYGTDPQKIIDLLVEVGGGHPDVLDDPQPAALFLGFGESSLDFQFRAWTREDFVRVSSELLVAINSALVNAGIEIPFPQRDLHLRSVDDGVAATLSGNGTKRRKL